jgi:hypothetical protein
MASGITTRWVEAAKAFAADAAAKVPCPECGMGWSAVLDSSLAGDQKERRLFCDKCGKHQFLRMKA